MRGLVQLIVVLVACLAGRSAGAAEDPPMLAGFAQRLSGETIVYHSPDPEVTAGLLVRSLDASRSVEWETAAVPADLDAEAVEFCWLFALQVDPARHRFTLSIDGAPAVAFTTAPSNSTRDWTVEGADGVSLRFRATMVDRFNDLMGYAILRVPRAKLRPGQPLRLSMHGETSGSRAWCITFQAAASAKASLRVLPALVRDAAGNYRPVEVSITHVGEPADAIITPSFGAPIRQRLEFGGNLLRLRHPEVDARREISVGIAPEGGAATTLLGSIEPVRHWSIDLVQHTHTDVGYTRPQTEILPEHLRFIDTALDYCDQTDGYPDDARFRWTCETSWAVREYLRTRSPAQIERLRRRAVEGRIEVTAMFLNMSEIVDEASFSAFLAPVAMARAAGIPVTTAVQNDVNGIAWCLADHFADLGIDYLVMGQHGHKALVPFDRPTPFWWESPAGRRVLAFRADHYHTGNFWGLHTGNIEAVEPELLRYLERLAASGYPFDRIAVENSGYPTDNAPPSTAACEVVRRWNERFVWPRLRSSVAREFPASLAKEHATELPVLRQAWTDWWTDGFGSAARETAAARRTQGRLVATEAVLAMEAIAGDQPPFALRNDVDAVRDALLFWGEHTLGAAESIREPLCENSVVQWAEKAAYAWDAVKREAALGEAVLGRLEAAPRGGRESRLLVVNPLGTRRSGTVELYADHELWPVDRVVRVLDETGKALAVQRLASRAEGSYWAIEVDDVPAFGWRTYRLERTDELAPPHAPSRGGQRLESPSYTLDSTPAAGRSPAWSIVAAAKSSSIAMRPGASGRSSTSGSPTASSSRASGSTTAPAPRSPRSPSTGSTRARSGRASGSTARFPAAAACAASCGSSATARGSRSATRSTSSATPRRRGSTWPSPSPRTSGRRQAAWSTRRWAASSTRIATSSPARPATGSPCRGSWRGRGRAARWSWPRTRSRSFS